MVTIEYKILFEVRFLHDYYLTDRLGNSFFSLGEGEQSAMLEEKLRKERYDIHEAIHLLMSRRDQEFLRNHRMKMVKTPLGFFIGVQVNAEKSGGGKFIYQPYIFPKQDAAIRIGLGINNQLFSNLTNLPISIEEDHLFYFTNTGKKDKNLLSQPIAKLKKDQDYLMGDLSMRGNHVYKAIEKNSGETKFWQRIEGNGFVHQGDLFPIRQESWYRDWVLGLGQSNKSPIALLSINLRSENPELSPLKEDGYLTTEFLPTQTRPQHPVFELRFLGRTTYWRYRKTGGFSAAERDRMNEHAGEILAFENGDFITKVPYFLAAERPYLSSNGFRLPSALPYLIKFENDKVYSDIYFSAINPVHDEA
jgi:hypothetical protein